MPGQQNHGGRNEPTAGSRYRNAHKPACARFIAVDIKPGQPHRARENENPDGDQQNPKRIRAKLDTTNVHPCMQDQHRRGDAEGDEIGHRVKLRAKCRRCLEQSRGQAIHRIEQATPDDHPAGQLQIAQL